MATQPPPGTPLAATVVEQKPESDVAKPVMVPPPVSSADRAKLANERYRTVSAVFTYENSIYWTRSGFMLVAQAACLSGALRLLEAEKPTTRASLLLVGASAFALVLCWAWLRIIKAGIWWTDRWTRILRKLEPAAMDDSKETEIWVLRMDSNEWSKPPANANEQRIASTRQAPRFIAWAFVVVWTIALLIGGYNLLQKYVESLPGGTPNVVGPAGAIAPPVP